MLLREEWGLRQVQSSRDNDRGEGSLGSGQKSHLEGSSEETTGVWFWGLVGGGGWGWGVGFWVLGGGGGVLGGDMG